MMKRIPHLCITTTLLIIMLLAGCTVKPAETRQARLIRGLRALRENPTFYVPLEIAREAQEKHPAAEP
jgi:hypothetical protein